MPLQKPARGIRRRRSSIPPSKSISSGPGLSGVKFINIVNQLSWLQGNFEPDLFPHLLTSSSSGPRFVDFDICYIRSGGWFLSFKWDTTQTLQQNNMVSKLLLVLLLVLSVFAQITTDTNPSITTQSFSINPSSTGSMNSISSFSPINSNTQTTSSGGQVDIDSSQASSLINSLFSSNPSAARALQSSNTPAPTNAPAGAMLSQTAPTAAMRSSAGGSSSSYLGGYGNYITWGHWVQVLRCTWNYWGSGFCCNWVWVWRYW